MRFQRGPSATAQQPEVSDIRLLTRADLGVLAQPRPKQAVLQLRDNHHRIARALAAGLGNQEIAALCGISLGRIVTLKQDPAFIDLVAHYRAIVTAEFASVMDPVIDYLGSVRTKSLAMMEAKLEAAEAADELLPTRELVAMAELGLDRTGYGKVNRNININVDFAAKLESARQRSRTVESVRARPILEVEPSPPAPLHRMARPAPQSSAPALVPSAAGPTILRRL